MSLDTFYLALGLAFVGFAILVIVTVVSARYSAEAKSQRELRQTADLLGQLSADDELALRQRLGELSPQEAEVIRQRNLAVFDDGT